MMLIKFNHAELAMVSNALGNHARERQGAARILKAFAKREGRADLLSSSLKVRHYASEVRKLQRKLDRISAKDLTG